MHCQLCVAKKAVSGLTCDLCVCADAAGRGMQDGGADVHRWARVCPIIPLRMQPLP